MLGDTPAGSLVLGLAGLGVDLQMADDCRICGPENFIALNERDPGAWRCSGRVCGESAHRRGSRGGRLGRLQRQGSTDHGSGGSWSQSSLKASRQVHTLVQNGDDKGSPPAGAYVEDVVMPAVHDPHLGAPV